MNQRVKDLSQVALKLTPEERVGLVDAILASIQPVPLDVAAAWTAEIRPRIPAYGRGEFELQDSDDDLADARSVAPLNVGFIDKAGDVASGNRLQNW